MFQFPGFALNPYGFRVQYLHLTLRSAKPPRDRSRRGLTIQRVEGGFPHSEIPGSKLVRSSPRHIAAYHVLHRLSAPRHPPDALKTLDRSHDPCPPLSGQHVLQPAHPRQRSAGDQKDLFPALARNVFACQMDPAHSPAGAVCWRPASMRWLKPDPFPLYDFKHPHAVPQGTKRACLVSTRGALDEPHRVSL